jgi:hypothetical protein
MKDGSQIPLKQMGGQIPSGAVTLLNRVWPYATGASNFSENYCRAHIDMSEYFQWYSTPCVHMI